ncbi:TrbI/VirB10 family protein [Brevundimonas sp. BR2-1]|uniref:TrbI/VirB10 family protein n=1 Tax=Brevundimonas sp. BR2-1 TaxID=3031123 RepID=UPI0030A5027F
MTLGPDSARPADTAAADIRPMVARRRGPAPTWLLFGGVVLGGVLLFAVLDGQRRAATAPTTQARSVDRVSMPAHLPPLYLPPEPPPPPPLPAAPEVPVATPPPAVVAQIPRASAPSAPLPNFPAPAFAPPGPAPAPVPVVAQGGGTGVVLVVDTTAPAQGGGGAEGAAAGANDPVRTTRLRRQAMTVPQGTLIPAVLETALDSTRPGHVRAIVSRDITGFDGRQILIPRGTRLFGDYQSDMAPGQGRALVQWTRLVRPDGVSVALASPAADMQGRAGVQGRVDSHFLERFSSALLQSTMNIGSALVTRSIGGDAPVIVSATGAVTAPATATTGSNGQPTLRVDAGARVAVLVARDLEFSSGEARQ